MTRILPWRAEAQPPKARIPATPAELEAIRARCRRMVTKRALASAGVALVPVPGADILADVTMLVQLIERINAEFGLTPAQIERLNPQRRLAVYKAVVAFGGAMVGRVVTTDLVIAALRLVGMRLTARQAARWVPVAGQATAAAISFAAMRYVGNRHIDDCVHVVDALLGPEDEGPGANGGNREGAKDAKAREGI
ncbi:MAG: hypothetical protein N2544_10795 [Burkholderiales bacterium]|nr:hypothetical protein [Burkholderiales bacterium]